MTETVRFHFISLSKYHTTCFRSVKQKNTSLIQAHLFYTMSNINESTLHVCHHDTVTCSLGGGTGQVSVQEHTVWNGVCLQGVSLGGPVQQQHFMGEEACGVTVSCQRTWQWLGACYWCAVDMRSHVSLKHVPESHQQKDNALPLTNCFSESVCFNTSNPLLSFSFPLLSSPSFIVWFEKCWAETRTQQDVTEQLWKEENTPTMQIILHHIGH